MRSEKTAGMHQAILAGCAVLLWSRGWMHVSFSLKMMFAANSPIEKQKIFATKRNLSIKTRR